MILSCFVVKDGSARNWPTYARPVIDGVFLGVAGFFFCLQPRLSCSEQRGFGNRITRALKKSSFVHQLRSSYFAVFFLLYITLIVFAVIRDAWTGRLQADTCICGAITFWGTQRGCGL